MTLLGIGLGLAVAAAWILVPLWRNPAEVPIASGERDDLDARHRQLLLSLQDLDFELQTGKLSPEDHQLMRGRIQSDAVGVLQKLEELTPDRTQTGPTPTE